MGKTYEALKRAEAERRARLDKAKKDEASSAEVAEPVETAPAEDVSAAPSTEPEPLEEPALIPETDLPETLPMTTTGRWARVSETLRTWSARIGGTGQSNGNGHPFGNGNGHPSGNGNGNGNGHHHANGNGNGNGNGHHHANGNGNGNGNGRHHANGNGNGNGHYASNGNGNGHFHGRKHFSFDLPPTTVEEFQQLRKNILASRSPRSLQMMLVVSSRHGEGVTTTTALLGSTMAQGGRCLVIDANFRTPGLTNVFGGETKSGLCEALADGSDGSAHVHPTDIPNLYYMPTGIGPMRVPYMFEGRSFDDLLASLRKEFDTILIDGAPMEMYADSAYLAPRTDGVIVVIQAEATPVSAPAISLRELERVSAPILGAVLNRTQNYIPEALTRLTNPQEVIEVAVIPSAEEGL